jgi:hypothetical protein
MGSSGPLRAERPAGSHPLADITQSVDALGGRAQEPGDVGVVGAVVHDEDLDRFAGLL